MIIIKAERGVGDSGIELKVSLPNISLRELCSIYERLAKNPFVKVSDVTCEPVRVQDTTGYVRIHVLLDAHMSSRAQFCAIVLLFNVIESFFAVSKIDVTGLA